jgi:tetratricopeptide (TPR) repeat protein
MLMRAAPLAIVCALGTPMSMAAATSPPAADAADLRRAGLEHGYNLDYADALAAFRDAIAADPQDAAAHRLAAATLWMQMLFEQGAVTVEDYMGQARATVTRRPPAPSLAAAFRDHFDRAVILAEQRLRDRPMDADAHFQLGATAGLRASYVATVEGRVKDGVGAGRRAYAEQQRVLTLDPSRSDAGLIVGLYRYGVSTLSLPMRLLARIAGFDGGREKGLDLVERAAAYPSETQTNARFALVLLYNREGRHADALRIIRELQAQYPRNRLLWLEAAGTALRARRPAEALAAVDAGLARLSNDPRPRAFGEEARWQSQREAALAALRNSGAAQ